MFAHMLAVALVLFQGASAGGSECSFSQSSMQQAAISCMIHEPSLMMQMAQHMGDPSQMETMSFLCNHEGPIVDVLMCLEHRLLKCLPQQASSLMELLPDHSHLDNALKFLCQNRQVLNYECMDEGVSALFLQCQQSRIQAMMSKPPSSVGQLKVAMCQILQETQSCLDIHHGTCSAGHIKVVKELMGKLMPTENCPTGDWGMNGALGSILVHGEPLKYKSEENRNNYN